MVATAPREATLLRPRVLAGVVLGSMLLSLAAMVLAADGASSLAGRIGGDFPAFYGAGTIVSDGDLRRLYDIERQARAQSGLLEEGSALYFAYPPPVAGAYAALSPLPYVGAYVVHTVLMVAAMIAAFVLLRPMLPPTRRPDGLVAGAVAFTFVPLFMAVTLGQNTAVLVLLVAASWRLARDGRDGLAGIALGLLLYKPQYAVPLIGLHLLRGRWRLLATSGAVAVGWWVTGAVMLGWSWTGDWIAEVGEFNTIDAEVNGDNAISFLGIAEHLLGVGSGWARLLGALLSLAAAATLVVLWRGRANDDLALPMAAASVGILLISPHAMFYDAGLLVLTVVGLGMVGHVRLRWLLAAGWAVGALHSAKDVFGLTPVSVVVLGAFAAVIHAWRRSRTPDSTLSTQRSDGATGGGSISTTSN